MQALAEFALSDPKLRIRVIHILEKLVDTGSPAMKSRGKKLLYSYNMERLPGWSTVGKHLDKITPMDRKPIKAPVHVENTLKPYLELYR